MQQLETHICFGGTLSVYEHKSATLKCDMTFSVFLPPQAKDTDVPYITFLSGLTCTHDNFTTKAGAYKRAAQLGLAILAPDTSPRGDHVPDEADAYDFAKGAGFYINATQKPWAENYQMESYVTDELNQLACTEFPLRADKQGITGHSMGGHGALSFYLKHPEIYKSVSAFAPIVAPAQVPWGQKAFNGYLGDGQSKWFEHDSTALMEKQLMRENAPEILIDQGTGDQFLEEQLKPDLFVAACRSVGQKLNLRYQDGYDHSYYFIQSFIDDHLEHHFKILGAL